MQQHHTQLGSKNHGESLFHLLMPLVFHFTWERDTKTPWSVLGRIQWRGCQAKSCQPEPHKNPHQRPSRASITTDRYSENCQINIIFTSYWSLNIVIWFILCTIGWRPMIYWFISPPKIMMINIFLGLKWLRIDNLITKRGFQDC